MAMNPEFTTRTFRSSSTTIHGGFIYDNSHEDEDDSNESDEEDDPGDVVEAIKVWVPIALTLVLVLLVCFATIRAKTKRRRAREAGTSNPMVAVSGGVPMNVNVYRNYGVYVNQLQQQQQQSGTTPGGVTPQEALQSIPYYGDAPPSYEDTMKISGAVNASFSASQESISPQRSSDPPPYVPTDPQSEAANAESGAGQSSSSTGSASAQNEAGQSSRSREEPVGNEEAGQSSRAFESTESGSGQSSRGIDTSETRLESTEASEPPCSNVSEPSDSAAVNVDVNNSISAANTQGEGPTTQTESHVTLSIDDNIST